MSAIPVAKEYPNIIINSRNEFIAPLLKYKDYDKIIVWFSGGKDSVCCVLSLLESGIKPEQIELHHHLVDGDVKNSEYFMDWAVTEDYCRKFAAAFGIEIFFSWKEGGFEREMTRDNEFTAPILFEDENHNVITSHGSTNPKHKNTRNMFPQLSASLSERWCSGYLKVDVGDRLIRKQVRFANGKKYLVVSGERAQESSARASYKIFESARSDLRNSKRTKRYIDQYRLAHQWQEDKVWDIMKHYGVNPHPAYKLGFSRTSCQFCIFAGKDHLATLRKFSADRFEKIANYEKLFGVTIKRPGKNKETLNIHQIADTGKAFDIDESLYEMTLGEEYKEEIFIKNWEHPMGAFGDISCGSV